MASPAKKQKKGDDGTFVCPNPHLKELKVDYLYHLGLDTSMPLAKMFGDVQYVCMGGSAERMEIVAHELVKALNIELPTGTKLTTIGKTERFNLYKVGPVISVSHGMGMPSMLILLHEMAKLVQYAGMKNVVFIRVGTSGGVGVEPGTVVVTNVGFNGLLEPAHTISILGKAVHFPTHFDSDLVKSAVKSGKKANVLCVEGATMGTDDFYEGQARLDGATCEYNNEDKMAFLQKCHEKGIRNIEMEGPAFAAFCNKAGIKGLVICVTLLNRLNGDQITSTHDELVGFSLRAIHLVIAFIKDNLKK